MTGAFNKIFRDRELLQKMLTLRDSGWSITALSLEFKCLGCAISYRCKQHGVKPKKITFGKKNWVALNNMKRIKNIKTPKVQILKLQTPDKEVSDSLRDFRDERFDERGDKLNRGKLRMADYYKADKNKKI